MKNKKYNYLILIITILLCVLVTTRFNNLFGSDTDWINQHTVIPDYFRMLFYQTGKFVPNLALAYGGFQNIFNFSYYGLLSPIILPSYMFPFLKMETYITITNIIILIVSAIMFYNFLDSKKISNFVNLITSLLFILSGPLIFHMHRHIMFVNYMPFLLMSLIGVDKYLKENKKSLLILGVFLMIMTSYYYSVTGIIVVSIYYLYCYFTYNKKILIKQFIIDLFKFIFLILISVLMSSILLLPTMYTLLAGRGNSDNSTNLLSLLIPNIKFHKVFSGTYAIGLPGIGFISLLYLFYTKKKNNIIVATLTSIILFIPVFCYVLNGFLYLREKCFIPFLPLCSYFVAIFLNDLFNKKIDIKKFIKYLLIIIIPLYIFNRLAYSYLIIILFIVSLLIYKNKKSKLIIATFLLLITGLAFIVEASLEESVSYEYYNRVFDEKIEETINNINKKDKGYYRTNNLNYSNKVVNKIYNEKYFTTNIYSSTYNYDYLNFVRKVFGSSVQEYNYFLLSGNSNLLFNTFMGVKYLYSPSKLGIGYKKIDNNLYLNELAYPLMYVNNNIISEEEFNKYSYPYTNELLLKYVISNKNVNSKVESQIQNVQLGYQLVSNDGAIINKVESGYKIDVSKEAILKLKLNKTINNKLLFIKLNGLKANTCRYNNISMTINNVNNILTCKSWLYDNQNNDFKFLISESNLEYLNIELTKGTYDIENIETYLLDYDYVKEFKNDIKEFKIEKIENDTILGNISIDKDGYLVTSIPFDDGFSIKVNNENVKPEKVNNAFLGIYLNSGDNNVEISYNSPMYKEGKIITILGFLTFNLIVVLDLRKTKLK